MKQVKQEKKEKRAGAAMKVAKSYVNKNRLLSVISKDPGLVQEGQELRLADLLTKDALEDFEKDHSEDPRLGNATSSLRKALRGCARYFVAENIKRIRADLN